MSEEVQRRAFEPFFTTRRNRGGTGLGLHIVYNLVTRRLGGSLRLESQPGHGTVFRIRLPLAAPKDEYVDTTLTLAELE
jgi:signal transduction histidine kinase